MARQGSVLALALAAVVGCAGPREPLARPERPPDGPHPGTGDLTPPRAPSPQGTLDLSVRWPSRRVAAIPLSAETIRIRVRKDGAAIRELSLSRPPRNEGAQVARASFQLDAAPGLEVVAEAFRTAPVASGDLPVASATAPAVTVRPNQRTAVRLDLVPAFVPVLARFWPENGGPGVPVVLEGTFGASGYYGMRIGESAAAGGASGSAIVVPVPPGASSGAVVALDDGIPSAPGPTFSVLVRLALVPEAATVSPGQAVAFSVPAGTETWGAQVASPTITRWDVQDPAAPPSPIWTTSAGAGSVGQDGRFTGAAAGVAWVRAWSGTLSATAEVRVIP